MKLSDIFSSDHSPEVELSARVIGPKPDSAWIELQIVIPTNFHINGPSTNQPYLAATMIDVQGATDYSVKWPATSEYKTTTEAEPLQIYEGTIAVPIHVHFAEGTKELRVRASFQPCSMHACSTIKNRSLTVEL